MTLFRLAIPWLSSRRVTVWKVIVHGRPAGNIIAAQGSIHYGVQDSRHSSILLTSTMAFGNEG